MDVTTDAEIVVGIGASAGGLEPLEQFFGEMPSNSGLAFVVIQHLSPSFKSLMDELLGRHTEMQIFRVEEDMRLEPDSVYLIPPGMSMSMVDRTLHLKEQQRDETTPQHPINVFFSSMAEDLGERAIGIVLSGTGSDGSLGIKAIQAAGGLTIVQDKVSAKFDGMPRSAIETGAVDCVVPPIEMPAIIQEYAADPLGYQGPEGDAGSASAHDRILQKLRKVTELDFAQYKQSTVRRRIERRIQLSGLASNEEYADLLIEDPEEVHRLYRDLLIGVTRFFRDREAFRRLEQKVIPELFESNKTATDELRVWVAGCATGEEAYSIAILLHERAARMPSPPRIRVFATDAHQTSLEIASAGRYGREFLSEVTPARLERYFTPVGEEFQVVPELRQLLTFAQQNLLQDAPFTRIDLLTCRNLLIYLLLPAQARIMHLFHFALKVGGILFLGPSESVGSLKPEFASIDNHWRLYRKRREVRLPSETRLTVPPGGMPRQHRPKVTSGSVGASLGPDTRLLRAYDSLLEDHVPPSILVNESREVIHTFGAAREFMNPPRGRVTLDILELVDPGVKVALGAAIQRASKDLTTVTYRHVGPPPSTSEGESEDITSGPLFQLTVKPLPDREPKSDSTFFLITIQREMEPREVSAEGVVVMSPARRPAPAVESHFDASTAAQSKIASLEVELHYAKESLQATIEEMETSNEELNAANEELIASNEELQSTNEELHSVNEELYTVNSEFQRKITEMTEITDDINNLLSSTDIAVLFLDRDQTVRRFTPVSAKYFHLRDQDIGRPLSDFTHTIVDVPILEDVDAVLRTEAVVQREVMTQSGQSLLMRALPYRTGSQVTAGVVLTLVDTSLLLEARKGMESATARFEAFMQHSPAAKWALDSEGRYAFVNAEYLRLLGLREVDCIGQRPIDVLLPETYEAFNIRAEQTNQLARAEKAPLHFTIDVPVENDLRSMYVSLFRFDDASGQVYLGGSALDITEQKRLQGERDVVQARYELAIRGAKLGAWDWDLGTNQMTLSDTALTMLGYEASDLTMSHNEWLGLARAEDRVMLKRALDDHLTGDSASLRLPFRMKQQDGSWRWVVCVGEVTERDNGEPTRMTGMTIDVNDLKEAEAALFAVNSELLTNNDQLAARNHELDQFAHAASHDLRSPLRTITGFTEILKEELGEIEPGASSALSRIEGAAKRMGELIDSLLLFASVGRGEARSDSVDIGSALREILRDLGPEIESASATVELLGTFPVLSGDPVMLRQLFQNLLGNALKYRGEQAPIVKVTGTLNEQDRSVEICFADNGIGFRQEDAEKAFVPFLRLHSTGDYRGSGLGLSICKRVVERHNGTIQVETAPGEGTVFCVTLPLESQ